MEIALWLCLVFGTHRRSSSIQRTLVSRCSVSWIWALSTMPLLLILARFHRIRILSFWKGLSRDILHCFWWRSSVPRPISLPAFAMMPRKRQRLRTAWKTLPGFGGLWFTVAGKKAWSHENAVSGVHSNRYIIGNGYAHFSSPILHDGIRIWSTMTIDVVEHKGDALEPKDSVVLRWKIKDPEILMFLFVFVGCFNLTHLTSRFKVRSTEELYQATCCRHQFPWGLENKLRNWPRHWMRISKRFPPTRARTSNLTVHPKKPLQEKGCQGDRMCVPIVLIDHDSQALTVLRFAFLPTIRSQGDILLSDFMNFGWRMGFVRPQKPPESVLKWLAGGILGENLGSHLGSHRVNPISAEVLDASWLCVSLTKKNTIKYTSQTNSPSKWLVLRVFPDVANSEKGSSLQNHGEACLEVLKVYASRIKLRRLYHCNPSVAHKSTHNEHSVQGTWRTFSVAQKIFAPTYQMNQSCSMTWTKASSTWWGQGCCWIQW